MSVMLPGILRNSMGIGGFFTRLGHNRMTCGKDQEEMSKAGEAAGDMSCIPALAIVLAAGEGTRMRSRHPKVVHEIAGLPMLGHVLTSVGKAGLAAASVVVGPNRDDVAAAARSVMPDVTVHVQTDRKGTAHATLHADDDIAKGYDVVVVLFGDTPLVRPETIRSLCDAVLAGNHVVALGFRAADPTNYGRLITKGGELIAIREHKDASAEERKIDLCNAGLMALDGRRAREILDKIGNDNAQQEYYLTDAVEVACAMGLKAFAVEAPEAEVMGVNDRVQLSAAERVLQDRLRDAAMRNGVTMIDPSTVYFSHDTKIGRDVIVEPNVFFGTGVSIDDNAVIHAHSHLEGASVGEGAHVGPFARLRPGTVLGKSAKVGNFVEIKNADVAEGAKVNHLSYIGDAVVGPKANIGAGVITCNYDGYFKHRTVIGANAFVGSNSALVAPVTVADGAFVGSGSVVTENVPAGALALARGQQVNKPGWADRYHKVMAERKASKAKK
jgi:bifunctional UDP-N-acetylglucosamine pyrophosphorylase / glucosamine-1-phosphate N-acetyltransferase